MIRWKIGFLKLLCACVWAERLKLAPLANMFALTGGRIGRKETHARYLNLKMMHEALQGLILEARNGKAKTFTLQLDSVVVRPGVHDGGELATIGEPPADTVIAGDDGGAR